MLISLREVCFCFLDCCCCCFSWPFEAGWLAVSKRFIWPSLCYNNHWTTRLKSFHHRWAALFNWQGQIFPPSLATIGLKWRPDMIWYDMIWFELSWVGKQSSLKQSSSVCSISSKFACVALYFSMSGPNKQITFPVVCQWNIRQDNHTVSQSWLAADGNRAHRERAIWKMKSLFM